MIGRSLGDFVLREKLADGGFGEIYRAEQPRLAREAVVKVLRARLEARDAVRVAFVREVQLASRLDHPFAAHVYDCRVEADGLLWIAMELVRGTPLDELLAARGPMRPDQVVPLLEKIAEVAHTAHEQGIVHRDLKP
ncbi:MAG TPA: protein kinase, partial [Planctomycetota bacterium]|nr:protein kinase [Planctomycetota bacterium]